MGRAPCCDKANVKKGPWSPEEDSQLKHYIETYGTGGNWISLPQKAGLRRCGKSCRLRWLNYLRPNIKHGEFSAEEDRIICTLFATIGSRWSIIAGELPGRTDNDIKNYWNTKLKKKLMGMKMVVSSSTTPVQIIKKTQTLSPISYQNPSFDQPLMISNNNTLNQPKTIPSSSTTTSSLMTFNPMISGCLVTNNNPFYQMGFEFASGFMNYSNNGFEVEEGIINDHQKLMHGNNNNNTAVDYDYDGLMLMKMKMEMEKKMKEEKYCSYY